MAVFNPQVQPTQDPNYLRYARVVEPPPSSPVISDTSTGMGLTAAAQGLESAVTLVDTAIKKGISNTAYEQVDPLRDKYTSGLEQIKSDLNAGLIPAPSKTVSGTTTGSLLDSNASADDGELPAGLESGLTRVQQLAVAKAAGSPRLNDTQYAKDTLSVAKQLRNQFPGYREYIDQKVSEASGLPVANSYYMNMLQDINRQLNQINKTKDEIGTTMMKNLDVPGMAGYIDKRKAGDPAMTDSFILGKVGEWQNLQTQQKIDAATRAENTDLKKDNVEDQDRRLTRTLNSSVALEMSTVKDLGGVGTPADLLNYFNDVSAGKIKQSDAEVSQKKLMFNSWVTQVERRMNTTATGYADIVGSDTAQKRIKDAMAPIYTMQKFVNSKEDGPAFYHAQQVEAIKNDSIHNFLINKDTGKESQQLFGARAILGDQYFPTFIQQFLANGVDLKYKDMFNQEAMSAIQPYSDNRNQPIPRYMKDAIKHGKDVGATSDSNYYDSVTSLVNKVIDPTMPLAGKDKLIDWAFNPKNVGRLDELKMDYRDPKTGEMVPGKYRAFNILSAPAITQAVKETAAVHPENYQKYQSTLEQEFGKLYRSDVLNLNKIMEKPYLGVHFSFNDVTNNFGLVDSLNRPVTRNERALGIQNPNAVYVNGVLDVLDRVNGGVSNLANVHKNNPQGPGDTSQYLLQTLQTVGFRPGENINGATEGMMKAIIKTKSPEMTPEELNKKIFGTPGGVKPMPPVQPLNFSPEEDNSLSSFLRSPTANYQGGARPRQGIRGNLSDERLMSIDTQEIPEGMDAREFIKQLKAGKKFGGNTN